LSGLATQHGAGPVAVYAPVDASSDAATYGERATISATAASSTSPAGSHWPTGPAIGPTAYLEVARVTESTTAGDVSQPFPRVSRA